MGSKAQHQNWRFGLLSRRPPPKPTWEHRPSLAVFGAQTAPIYNAITPSRISTAKTSRRRMRTNSCQHCLLAALMSATLTAAVQSPALADTGAQPRPNILWLTSEDHGPQLGCYGDELATTPHIDALAARGMIYLHCWSNAPVCAPARTTLISGLYANSTGSEHMRSMVPYPRGMKMFPQILREAGYYCTNNAKEDYNLAKPGRVWDESSAKAHWSHRAADQPFFAVFNSQKSHESQLRIRPHRQVHDPARVRVPAYHPDAPEVRQDWAQYYDCVTAADADAGARLKELAEAGLAESTIVFYFADHGPGMPGNKRWPRESGLHVPLIVYIPDVWRQLRPPEYQPGGQSQRLVSFVDFAPTVLSLAGIRPPEWMQGHAFLGKYQAAEQPFLFGFRGRMDERYDLVRCATDGRFVYVRNFRPDKIYGQRIDYLWQTPTTRVWQRWFREGKLNEAQAAFWKTKPVEELYDVTADRDEVHNLASSPEHAETRNRLRSALREHLQQIRDVAFLPEGEMHRRSLGTTPYDLGHDPTRYPFERVYQTAELASSLDDASDAAERSLRAALADADSGVRYWAVLGHLMRGAKSVAADHEQLIALLRDPSPDVQIAAAEALGRYGDEADLRLVSPLLAERVDGSKNDVFTVMAALNAGEALGPKAAAWRQAVLATPAEVAVPDGRFAPYVHRLREHLQRSSDN